MGVEPQNPSDFLIWKFDHSLKERGKKAVLNRRSLELKCLSDKNLSKPNGTSRVETVLYCTEMAMSKCLLLCSGIPWGLPGKTVSLDGKLRRILKALHLESLKMGNSFWKKIEAVGLHSHHDSEGFSPNILNLGLLLAMSHLTGWGKWNHSFIQFSAWGFQFSWLL